LAFVVCAHAESLNVKTGGWEITTRTTLQNSSLSPGAANLPPEKRAAIEKALQERSGKSNTRTHKTCVTREDLDSGQGFKGDDDEEGKCTVKVIANTRNRIEQELTCSSPPSKTRAVFEAKDAEHMVGVIERSSDGSKGPGSARIEMSGRWVSASCKGFDD
jgi:hypothetical protein